MPPPSPPGVPGPPPRVAERAIGPPDDPSPASVRLEIPTRILSRLFDEGRLCAADVRCLDCDSKRCLWRMMLMSSTGSKARDGCDGNCAQCGKRERSPVVRRIDLPVTAEAFGPGRPNKVCDKNEGE